MPVGAGEEGEAGREAEENLRQGRMRRGNRHGQIKQHGDAAQYRLRQHRHYGRKAHPSNPAPRVLAPNPYGQNNGEDANRSRNHAVAVLKLYPSHHARHAEGAEGRGPVGNRKAGVVAGHQRAGNNQKKRAKRDERRVTMKPRMVFRHGRYLAPEVCVSFVRGQLSVATDRVTKNQIGVSALGSSDRRNSGSLDLRATDNSRPLTTDSLSKLVPVHIDYHSD